MALRASKAFSRNAIIIICHVIMAVPGETWGAARQEQSLPERKRRRDEGAGKTREGVLGLGIWVPIWGK